MFGKKFLSVCLGTFISLVLISCGGGSKPLSIALSSSTATIDGANAITFTATVTNDKNSAGVTWSLTGAGTLSSTSTSSVTYTAPAATSTAQSATLTATSAADATKTATITITIPAKPAIASTNSDVAGQVGASYAVTLKVTGGISPYTWSLSAGTLPPCLTLNTATGVITGTVTASCAGTYTPTFTVSDSGTPNKLTATQQLTIVITAAPPVTFVAAPAATGTVGVAYSSSVAATGGVGAFTYTKASGSLPAGLSLASSGAITGTPTAAAVGTSTFTVTATDAFGDTATSGTYSITVSYPQLTVTTTSLPAGYGNTSYSQALAASGGSGTGYSWVVTSNATALTALNLSLSSGGVLTGTPPVAGGTASFGVQVTDSASNTATGTVSVTIHAGLAITTATALPAGYGNTAYSQALATSGGTGTGLSWSVTSGASTLTALNLSLSSAGVLSGTPPVAGGSASFGVTVTDSASNTATANFTLTVNPGVTVTAPTLASAYPGTAYASPAFTAAGGSGAGFTWTMAAASGSSVPTGFTIGSATGIIAAANPANSGTSTATYNVVITATDSLGNKGSANVTLSIEATLAVATSSLPGGSVGVAYSQALAASGGSGTYTTWQVTAGATGSNSLQTVGLSLSTAGVLSGSSPTAGTANFTVQVTDSQSHTATKSFTVTVYTGVTITTTTLPPGNMGASYSQQLVAAGGTGTGYTWTATASNLSTYGLSLSSAGVVSGTPTASGTASFTANVKDSANNSTTQALTITLYSGVSLPAPNPPGLSSSGYVGVAYSGTIMASGGSGSYSWTTSGLSDNLTASPSGNTLTISGTPSSAATVTFSATVTDTTTGNSVTQTGYSITIATPTPVTLPTPNPSSLPTATVNQNYNGAINASGGVPPYTWSINGTTVSGGGLSLGNGTLSASSTGGSSLTLMGTPSSTGTVTLTNVKVTDSVSSNATNTYTIAVNSAGSQVNGHISLNTCGGSGTLPTVTLTINTTTPQQVQTDSSGNFSFASVPNGSWTITPSISGPSSAFYPATQSVTVNNANLNNINFNASLGYTVSGTVSYGGSKTGRVYVMLNNNNCGGTGSQPGTSISAAGSFTINGVAPGSYTLTALMDTLGYGSPNANDPSGSSSVTVASSNFTGANVTMADPSAVTLSSGPKIQIVSPANGGAAIPFSPIKNSNGTEMATSYTVQWSTSSSFSSITGSKTFPANGDGTDVWILTGLTDGQTLYFRAQGAAGSSTSPWTVYGGGTPTAVTIGAPTGGSTITGTVTFTGTATGPLMVGFYSQTNGVYTQVISNPVSPQAFTVHVPNGSGYFQFGIIDQNNNGIVDSGDINNTSSGGSSNGVTISGNATMNLTLPNAGSNAKVTTTYYNQTYSGGTSTGYSLNFDLRMENKLPVKVQLTAGPNVIHPLDIAACSDCGRPQFQLYANLSAAVPAVGDSYTLHVTYVDGTSEDLTLLVSGWNGTSTLVGASNLATNLSPAVTGTTTPTFTWTDPSGASSYVYQFNVNDNSGNQIWEIPGQSSNLNGFSSSITSITWPTDPTDSSNTPTVGSLTHGTTYNWQITVQDSTGNSAQQQVYFVP